MLCHTNSFIQNPKTNHAKHAYLSRHILSEKLDFAACLLFYMTLFCLPFKSRHHFFVYFKIPFTSPKLSPKSGRRLVDLDRSVNLLHKRPTSEEADGAWVMFSIELFYGRMGFRWAVPVRMKNRKEISALYPMYSTLPASPPSFNFVTQ